MKDQDKTTEQLINELIELRQQVAELEAADTERKLAQEELSVAYDTLASSVNGVIIADLEGKIIYANPAFLRMFGYEDSLPYTFWTPSYSNAWSLTGIGIPSFKK